METEKKNLDENIQFRREDYLEMLPENILISTKLNDSCKVILGVLINNENRYDQFKKKKDKEENELDFHISNSRLEKLTGFAKPTIIKELGKMKNENLLGFIERVSGNGHLQSHYKINWERVLAYRDNVGVNSNTLGVKSDTLGVNSGVKSDTENTLPIEYSIIEDRIKKIEDKIYNIEKSIYDLDEKIGGVLEGIDEILSITKDNLNTLIPNTLNTSIGNEIKNNIPSSPSEGLDEDIIKNLPTLDIEKASEAIPVKECDNNTKPFNEEECIKEIERLFDEYDLNPSNKGKDSVEYVYTELARTHWDYYEELKKRNKRNPETRKMFYDPYRELIEELNDLYHPKLYNVPMM